MAVSRPFVYGSLVCVFLAAYWWMASEPAKAAKAPQQRRAARKAPGLTWDFPVSETSLRFDEPRAGIRNVFKALIITHRPGNAPGEEEELMKLPAYLADGEADWAYTGMVEIDGKKLAFLENGTNHQGGYVREGETWKRSRIVSITLASVVFAGEDGSETTVYRLNPNKPPRPKPLPDPGFRPIELSPALKGPIGFEIRGESMAGPPASVPTEIRKNEP